MYPDHDEQESISVTLLTPSDEHQAIASVDMGGEPLRKCNVIVVVVVVVVDGPNARKAHGPRSTTYPLLYLDLICLAQPITCH